MQWAIVAAAALLLAGFLLRARVRLLQMLFIPASVVGGLLGLVLLQAASRLGPTADVAVEVGGIFRSWPGFLIAVVFAGLLLEHREKRLGDAARGASLAAIAVWIIVLGQMALGLLAAWLLIGPWYDVPVSFGQLIEAGFAGGHGTATALGTVYADLVEFPAGLDLGLFMATFGLVYSVVSGIAFVNIGVRRGWTRAGRADRALITGLEQRGAPMPAAFARIRGEVLDPLAFQLVLLALAFGLGMLLQQVFVVVAGLALPLEIATYLENVPLFLFTLIGGLLLRRTLAAFGLVDLLDAESIKRLVAIAMEFLIVAAIASLRLEAIATYFWPVLLLVLVGCAWTAFCLVVLSRRLLPAAYWFELGILNYGMSTGTTAQGMMLLRIVDPDLESGAAEDYALAAPLSAPFVGGGIVTLSLPLIVANVPAAVVAGVLIVVAISLYAIGRKLRGAVGGA